MKTMTLILLEDRDGRTPLEVDWLAALRPRRIEHDGRTFDAVGQDADGTWIYRTSQEPLPTARQHVRFERGEACNVVGEQWLMSPLPNALTFQDEVYQWRSMGSDGRPIYWHG